MSPGSLIEIPHHFKVLVLYIQYLIAISLYDNGQYGKIYPSIKTYLRLIVHEEDIVGTLLYIFVFGENLQYTLFHFYCKFLIKKVI